MANKKKLEDKVHVFIRLCNEAIKRSAALRKVPTLDNKYKRWENAYRYKLSQAAAAGDTIRGDEAYYGIASTANVVLDGTKETDDNAKVLNAALNEARRILIQLNQ